ncbi:type II and III secretion system protein family protein [Halorhodospira sp. 9622]|uniref:type II and III secretion system protein family protein n=1 Tax=Halorhodospira sp. 9622 TaxID=2899136 RepID=UPI001EE8F9EA|nr:type II and III secretion system protein family protein [Halorhodospira sp. 9622]MCG5538632.1 type II and III secretion system protein family protein [Halorhodospira sp. 9622]
MATAMRTRAVLSVLIGCLLAAVAAHQAAANTLEFGDDLDVGEMTLALGKSQVVTAPTDLSQVVVGNPNIADVRLLSSRRVLLLGRGAGRTNLALRDEDDQVVALLDLVVTHDTQGLKRKLHELLPDETGIEVRSSNAAVILSGEVSDARALETALTAARSFAGDDVRNMLRVGGGQQVMLEVRIAEVRRNSLRELGVQGQIRGSSDSFAYDLITGGSAASVPGAFVDGLFEWTDVMLRLQALETRGAAKTLAEPNIVAISGQQASFLVGGEFPVPVVQSGGSDAITIDFKEFGVGLEFTPTVLSSETINLKLQTEVSTLDRDRGTQVLGTAVPGLSTRRAGTSIELGDGQSFAIAGLLQNDMDSVIRELPGLGRIPILGALFRSSAYQRNETELAIVVRPRLVQPGPAGTVRLPTDTFIPPSAVDQYLMGRLEGMPPRAVRRDEGRQREEQSREGGLEGAYGHEF